MNQTTVGKILSALLWMSLSTPALAGRPVLGVGPTETYIASPAGSYKELMVTSAVSINKPAPAGVKLYVNGSTRIDNGTLQLGRLPADPAAPSNGMLYFNTTTSKIRVYENNVWRDLTGGGGGGTGSYFKVKVANDINVETAAGALQPVAGVTLAFLAPQTAHYSIMVNAVCRPVNNPATKDEMKLSLRIDGVTVEGGQPLSIGAVATKWVINGITVLETGAANCRFSYETTLNAGNHTIDLMAGSATKTVLKGSVYPIILGALEQ